MANNLSIAMNFSKACIIRAYTVVILLWSFGPATMAKAQDLLSFKDVSGKYGYKDKAGKVMIQPVYRDASDFVNGIAQVGVPDPDTDFGTLWFLIDKKGNAITQKYSTMQQYGPVYRVGVNKKFGIISWDGRTLVQPIYEYINENNYKGYPEGVAVAKLNGKWGLIDTLGKVLVPFTYTRLDDYNEGLCPAQVNNLFGYINRKGEMVITAKYKSVFPFSNGYAWASLPEGCAIIDKKGNAICPFKYQYNSLKMTATFYDGMAPVYSKDRKLGFINTKGEEIIPCIYDYEVQGSYDFFIDGKAKVKQNGRTFYIDKTGKEIKANAPVNKPVAEKPLATPVGKLSIFKDTNGKYGLKDSKGTIIVAPKYDYINDFTEGMARVSLQTDGKDYFSTNYGYVDSTGKEIIPVQYASASGFYEGLAAVGKNGKTGFIDKAGKTVIPFMYDYPLNSFSEGLAALKLNGKMGFIDKNNKTVLPFVYDDAQSFKDGIALININNKYGFINKTGKQIVPATYDYAYGFYEGLAAVNKGGVKSAKTLNVEGGNWGFIDKSGKVVISLQYDNVNPFSEGLACVMQNKKAGYIDRAGKIVIPLQYETISSFQYGKAPVSLNGRHFYIDQSGKESKPSKKVTFNNGEYIGEVAKDGTTPEGRGKMVWTNGAIYEGDWQNGSFQGKGKYIDFNGKVSEGNFVNGKLSNVVPANNNTATPATSPGDNSKPAIENKRKYASVASPQPAENNFLNEIANATTSEARGMVLNKYISSVVATNYTDDEKGALIADKYASMLPVDFHAVHWSMMKVDSKTLVLIVGKVNKILPADQVKALKDMSQYRVAEYQAKYNNGPTPVWPTNVPQPGQGWKN